MPINVLLVGYLNEILLQHAPAYPSIWLLDHLVDEASHAVIGPLNIRAPGQISSVCAGEGDAGGCGRQGPAGLRARPPVQAEQCAAAGDAAGCSHPEAAQRGTLPIILARLPSSASSLQIASFSFSSATSHSEERGARGGGGGEIAFLFIFRVESILQ